MADPFPHTSNSPEGDPFHAVATTEVLAGICQDIIEEDSRFAEHLIPRARVSYDWDTNDGVTYSVGLTGEHTYKEDEEGANLYEESDYIGRSYELELEVSYGLGAEIAPEELQAYLRENDCELPDNIHDMTVTYGVQLGVSPANQLSWQAIRFYDIEYVTETAGATSMELVTDTGTIPINYSETGMEVSSLSHMRVALMQNNHSTPFMTEALPGMEETEDEMFARLVDQLIESCDSDPQGEWLNRAVAITEMVKFRSEGDFDLAQAFPAEVLELINES